MSTQQVRLADFRSSAQLILVFEQELAVFWILDYGNWSGKNREELEFLCLCEQETEEKLVCPLNSTRKNYGSGYKRLADNLQQFREIGELPIQASLSSLDEGNGIKRREAKWR